MPNLHFLEPCESEGKRKLEGLSIVEGRDKWIQIHELKWSVWSDHDSLTGKAISKRVHRPFEYVAELDASFAMAMEACAKNDKFPEMKFHVFRTAQGGGEEEHYQVTIKNVRFVEVSLDSQNNLDAANLNKPVMCRYKCVYSWITFDHKVDPVLAGDDNWQAKQEPS
jgi:type VI secretion system Hcp family effector